MTAKVKSLDDPWLMAVIGDPIAHSLSPRLHTAIIKELDRPEKYIAQRVERGRLEPFLQSARLVKLVGFNLTMPHKEDILPYLKDMTPEARRAGSVNSVRLEGKRFVGHSTDGLGFRRALLDMGYDFPDKTVTILGAGGAARSVAMTAVDSGAARVNVLNRTLARAEALCAGEGHMAALPLTAAETVLPNTDILVNTTPVGMAGAGAEGAFPFLSALKEGAPAADCVYAPAKTPFMAAAEAAGHPAWNGIGMLVYQAVYAYAFFHDETFDQETVARLGQLLLAASGVDPRGGGTEA